MISTTLHSRKLIKNLLRWKSLAPVLNTAALVSIMLKKSTYILMKLLTLQSYYNPVRNSIMTYFHLIVKQDRILKTRSILRKVKKKRFKHLIGASQQTNLYSTFAIKRLNEGTITIEVPIYKLTHQNDVINFL